MSGFNLPPGCSVNDIPGNRPGDDVTEKIYDDIYEALSPELPGYDARIEKIAGRIFKLIGDAYNAGYKDGSQEESLARQYVEGP